MKKVSKAEARKAFNKGETVYVLPSRLSTQAYTPYDYKKADYEYTFNECIVNYELHYCNKMVGKKAAFYIY